MGEADSYELYLVGAGREPEIMAKILKETRTLMEIPQASLCIVQSQLSPSYLLKGIGKLRKYSSYNKLGTLCWLEKKVLSGFVEKTRQEVHTIKTSILEGILD